MGKDLPVRSRFEFALHTMRESDVGLDSIDATLSLMGAQGWEIRALAQGSDGKLIFALQRSLDEEAQLPDSASLTAVLEEPLPPLEN